MYPCEKRKTHCGDGTGCCAGHAGNGLCGDRHQGQRQCKCGRKGGDSLAGRGSGEENEPPTRIYVSKGKKELTLYVNHQVIGVWACNIGTNSALGKKQVEGDRITPSGEYYICLRNPKSNYHLSLGLSYPDKSDADRGFAQRLISEAEKDAIYAAIDQGGCPHWKTALGGYVMIHGNKPLVLCAGCAQGGRCLCDGKRAA